MICNIGCTANGAHATEYKMLPRGIRRVFNMETYEIDFPIKHPRYVIPDAQYSRKRARIMAVGHPRVAVWRRIEAVLLYIRYKGFKNILAKLRHKKSVEK